MKLVIQRVVAGGVTVNNQTRSIGLGLVVLVGVAVTDTVKDADFLADKCLNLRIFNDTEGKMNRSVRDVQGQVLIVSQFTLYGDCCKGRRPGFSQAAVPATAIPLYERFIAKVKESGLTVQTGEFGAMMTVHIQNDGPVTLIAESKG